MTRPNTPLSSASSNSENPDHLSQGPAGPPGRAFKFACPRWTQGNWHLLANPAARFTDLGPGYYQARTDKDKKIKNHIRQIEALLGHPVTITPKAA